MLEFFSGPRSISVVFMSVILHEVQLFSVPLKKNVWLHPPTLAILVLAINFVQPLTQIWVEVGILPIYIKTSRFATTFSVLSLLACPC
jgi:hypothetical protein